GLTPRTVQGRVLAGPIQAHNDFGSPDVVSIKPLEGIRVESGALALTLPPCSVAALHVEV
ncbi:MAG TPA: alpha-L-arabinofuranosidase C-terminal domain-containing protein, partial [Clostridia bacterium]|nr:alpha-L-arabinofuranosidase C-terminal domain-containing protein [Clostridia bacterium]